MVFELNRQNLLALPKEHPGYELVEFRTGPHYYIRVYPRSVHEVGDCLLFLLRNPDNRQLGTLCKAGGSGLEDAFGPPLRRIQLSEEGTSLDLYPLTHSSAASLRELLDFTAPRLLGVSNSFGLGDRLGVATPGHLGAIRGTGLRAVLAQQSIREMERTDRSPQEVLDAASWAVLQEGFQEGFGADGDHLKKKEDIDALLSAGFTMLTLDPGDYVVNEADTMSESEALRASILLPWDELEDTLPSCLQRYENQTIRVSNDFEIRPSKLEVLRALAKYGKVISHVRRMVDHLEERQSLDAVEIELSVDETDSVTTPFEHWLIVSQLKRLGIELVSLAPRFVGDFEKGIDYKGDLSVFREEYAKHVRISEALGPYKLSLHSGSDKFSVYGAIGELGRGHFHVKTAGTSYLEALRTVALTDPPLFRKILDYSMERYPEAKASYHVSADLRNVPEPAVLNDDECVALFDANDDARQVLHVCYGDTLTARNPRGKYLFKENIMQLLYLHEPLHYQCLEKHFSRHIRPFLQKRQEA